MPKLLPKNRKLRLPTLVTAAVAVCALGYAGARYVVWPRVKTWREQRINAVAREKLAQGDYVGAMTAVHTSIRYNQLNTDAWKLGAEITAKQDAPEQIYFLQRVALIEPTLDNKLKFLRAAVKLNAFPQAQEVIAGAGAEVAGSAEFLELAALVSRRMGNPTRAKYYLMSLVALRPDDLKARFELAQIRLLEGFDENRPALRSEIRTLANEPSLRARALALLVTDALQAKNEADALQLADQLALTPDLAAPQQVLIAEAYHRYAPGKFKSYLAELQERFATSPEKVVVLAGYLISAKEAVEVRRWIETLPEKIRSGENVQMSYAYAMLLLQDWPALEDFLRGCKWEENEYVRHAMLAYRHRVAGNDRAFNDAWKLAVIGVGNNPRRLQILLAQIVNWGWNAEKYELLWKRFSIDPRDESTRRQLIAWERSQGNTAALNRLFARIVELDPKDLNSKNNYAYTSLLLGTNLDRAYQYAHDAFRSDPKNGYFITTQAFALYRQGKSQQALETLQTAGFAALSQPERTLVHALLLVENGKFEEGSSLASNVRREMFALPEERRLLANTFELLAKAEREQGSAVRLAALASSYSPDAAPRKSWLALLPPQLARPATIPMELADTFYAADDFPSLENSLKADRWEQNDFLRLALLTYALRSQGKQSEANSNWRTAIAGAGNNIRNLSALADMCEQWNWAQDRIDLLSRIYQRDPLDSKAFAELIEHFNRNGQTAELARIYEQRVETNPGDAAAKSHLAYYSLLTGSNLSRAHVLAKEAYEQSPADPYRIKVYAFSFLKQSRPADAWRLLEKLPAQKESGQAQVSLLKAVLASQQNDENETRTFLDGFDPATALPEESSLADSLAKTLTKKET